MLDGAAAGWRRLEGLGGARRALFFLVGSLLSAVVPCAAPGADLVRVPLEGDGGGLLEAVAALEGGRAGEGVDALRRLLGKGPDGPYLVEVSALFPGPLGSFPPPLAPEGGPEGAWLRTLGPSTEGLAGERFSSAPSPDAPSDGARGRRFLPVELVAGALLSSLQGEARSTLLDAVEPLGRATLAASLDVDGGPGLERCATELYWSSAGDEAAEILGDWLFLAGRYREATQSWLRILRDRSDTNLPAGRLLAKASAAAEAGGDGWLALAVRGSSSDAPAPAGTSPWKDRDLLVVRGAETSRWGGEVGTWPPLPRPGGMLELSWDTWVWSQSGLEPASEASTGFSSRRGGFARFRQANHYPFVPLVLGDRVYLSGVFNIFEFDGQPGAGALLRRVPKPVDAELARDFREDPSADGALYTVTCWDRAHEPGPWCAGLPEKVLIASFVTDRIRASDYMGFSITVDIPIRGLAAFDAADGRLLWRSEREGDLPSEAEVAGAGGGGHAALGRDEEPPDEVELEDPDEIGLLARDPDIRALLLRRAGRFAQDESSRDRGYSYTSPVVVKGGLVVAGGWRQRGYVQTSLRALDLRTGKLVWEVPLAGAQIETTMFGEMGREPLAGAILERDGTVYYATQVGAVAAVRLDSARLEWLSTYDTISVVNSLQRAAILRDLSWGPNPLLLVGGALIVTPRDSEYAYAFDAGRGLGGPLRGGTLLWRYRNPRGTRGLAELRDLLGYQKGLLYFSGPGDIAALDLTSMDALGRLRDGVRVSQGGQVEVCPRRTPSLRISGTLEGPALLTEGGIVASDEEGLLWIDEGLGRAIPLGPRPYRRSATGEYPGRLTAWRGGVLQTSRHLLSAYAPPAGVPLER